MFWQGNVKYIWKQCDDQDWNKYMCGIDTLKTKTYIYIKKINTRVAQINPLALGDVAVTLNW